jgi:hypothetical protein
MTAALEHYGAPAAVALEERRHTQRRRVLKGATLSFNRGYSAFECVVRNQSDGGVRISLAETFAVPTSFRLAISGESQIRSAHVAWRRTDEMGVTFVSS